MRGAALTRPTLFLAATLLASFPVEAAAQLRPYEPFDWALFDGTPTLSARAGNEILWGQRASLVGAEGRLVELGRFSVAFRAGRVAIEAGGTLRRYFQPNGTFTAPAPGVAGDPTSDRSDSGDYTIATVIRLTPAAGPAIATLRFGTRLPTTDNRVGLERDQTDFFALLGGRADRGNLRATAELGVGLHGTRMPDYEQSDVLVFVTGLAWRAGAVRPSLLLLGHADGLADRHVRGNEELAEVRLRLRTGSSNWLQVEAIRGLLPFSPSAGLSIAAGLTR
ncbi:MAG: hypothetical protein WD737_11240 [Gemmatimonadota bacterium]